MTLFIVRHITGDMTWYRHERAHWTSDLNKADLYTADELPPGEGWDIVDTDDLNLGATP